MKLRPDQLDEALKQARTVYIRVGDLLRSSDHTHSTSACVRIHPDHLTEILERRGRNGWKLNPAYTLDLRDDRLVIG